MGNSVLLLDSNKESLTSISEILELSGYNVIALEKNQDVLNIINTVRPEVILIDLKIRDNDGLQLAYELKQYPELNTIPIIGIIDYYLSRVPFKLINFFGITHYLLRPFNPLDLIGKIESALNNSGKGVGV